MLGDLGNEIGALLWVGGGWPFEPRLARIMAIDRHEESMVKSH